MKEFFREAFLLIGLGVTIGTVEFILYALWCEWRDRRSNKK